jgi:uroporphyrinogen-III synthase
MRVLVTRALEDAGPLVAALLRAGHEPVLVPLVGRAPGDPLPDGPFDLVVLTSAASADAARGVNAPVACVGPATAARAGELGLDVIAVGEGTGAELVARLDLRGKRVLYPRAAEATPETAAALRAAGAELVEVTAYRNIAPDGFAAALRAAWPVDAVTLMSGSAARRLAEAGLPLEGVRIVVIGPSTARECAAVGIPVHAVAERPDVEALVAAVSP